MYRKSILILGTSCLLMQTTACGYGEATYPKDKYQKEAERSGRLANEGFVFFQSKNPRRELKTPGVDQNLWKAAMEVIAPMPLNSTDKTNGVIITDWYTYQSHGPKRSKFVITIGDSEETETNKNLFMTITTQAKNNAGDWVDVEQDTGYLMHIKQQILSKVSNEVAPV